MTYAEMLLEYWEDYYEEHGLEHFDPDVDVDDDRSLADLTDDPSIQRLEEAWAKGDDEAVMAELDSWETPEEKAKWDRVQEQAAARRAAAKAPPLPDIEDDYQEQQPLKLTKTK